MRRRYNAIYRATNIITGKHYIGQTTFTLSSRKAAHKRKAFILGGETPFYKAIRKYGWDVFEWKIECYCKTAAELDKRERETIEKYGPDNCYNVYSGGISDYEVPEKVRKVLSFQKIGAKNPMYGKKLPEKERKALLKASMDVCQKSVCKLDHNGDIVERYVSISECARSNNIAIATVSLHANGKVKNQKYAFL